MQIVIFHGTRNREDFALNFYVIIQSVFEGVFELSPKEIPSLRSSLMLLS
jgi:hypothetical protein